MRAGRKSLTEFTIATWADSGEKWLKERFPNCGLEFHTKWDTEALTITLEVFKPVSVPNMPPLRSNYIRHDLLFTETCSAENFVNRLMVTKIMMVM